MNNFNIKCDGGANEESTNGTVTIIGNLKVTGETTTVNTTNTIMTDAMVMYGHTDNNDDATSSHLGTIYNTKGNNLGLLVDN